MICKADEHPPLGVGTPPINCSLFKEESPRWAKPRRLLTLSIKQFLVLNSYRDFVFLWQHFVIIIFIYSLAIFISFVSCYRSSSHGHWGNNQSWFSYSCCILVLLIMHVNLFMNLCSDCFDLLAFKNQFLGFVTLTYLIFLSFPYFLAHIFCGWN